MASLAWTQGIEKIIAKDIQKELEELRSDPLRSNRAFLETFSTLAGFSRITDKPFLMHAPTATQCVINTHVDVHGDRFCDIYISKESENVLRKGKGSYPDETIVVKLKYSDDLRGKVELYTVMRKMPKGYWSEHGDWEFSVMDANLKHVLARGRLESCAGCHDAYRESGYLTRTYLRASVKDRPNDSPQEI